MDQNVQSQEYNKPKMAYSRDLPKMAVMDDHRLTQTINGQAWTGLDQIGLD